MGGEKFQRPNEVRGGFLRPLQVQQGFTQLQAQLAIVGAFFEGFKEGVDGFLVIAPPHRRLPLRHPIRPRLGDADCHQSERHSQKRCPTHRSSPSRKDGDIFRHFVSSASLKV
jgi:hypothetical protein